MSFHWEHIRYIVCGILFACALLMTLINDLEVGVDVSKTGIHNSNIVFDAKIQSSLNDSAFVFLALGAQANQMNCPAAVESLVRYGGWDGDVYMITDRENCFDTDLIVKNAGMKKEKFHLKIASESFGNGGVDLMHPKVGLRKSRVRSFTMKTRLFDFIPEPHIKTLAYIDCDILFAQQGCAKDFISGGPSWEEAKVKFSQVAKNKEGRVTGLHAGTLVVHRDHSKEALHLWRQEIEKGQSEGDNDAYMTAFDRVQHDLDMQLSTHSNNSGSSSKKHKALINAMQPDEILIPNADKKNNRYEHFISPSNVTGFATLYCMNHISKARCGTYGRDVIQKNVDRFSLRTYEGRYPYCTHTVLQPLLYGWFPFSYLPFCPKMEQYL